MRDNIYVQEELPVLQRQNTADFVSPKYNQSENLQVSFN
jgi:hypothetical protein